MMLPPELEEIKEIPCYRVILKAMLKYQIQQLLKQLTEYAEEEAIIVSASLSDLTVSHLGTKHGKGFLDKYGDLKTKFLKFCLKESGGKPKQLLAKQKQKQAASEEPNSLSNIDQSNTLLHSSSLRETDTADLMSMTASAIQQNVDSGEGAPNLAGNFIKLPARLGDPLPESTQLDPNALPHLPPGVNLQRNPYPFLQKRRRQKRMFPYQRPKTGKDRAKSDKEDTATMDEIDTSLQDEMIIASALGEGIIDDDNLATEQIESLADETGGEGLPALDAGSVAVLTNETVKHGTLDVPQDTSEGENSLSNNGESTKDIEDLTKLADTKLPDAAEGSDDDDGVAVKVEKTDEEYDLFKSYLEGTEHGESSQEGGTSHIDLLSGHDIPTIQQRVRSIQGKIAAAKRKDLTLAERQHALELLDQGYSTRIVAKMYGVGRSQIQNILHRRHEILTALRNEVPGSSTRIRFKSAINEDINKLLYEWYVEEVKDGSLLTGPQIQAKALDIATDLQKSDFKASNSWLQRFIKEYNIKLLFSRGAAVPPDWQIPTTLSPPQL